MTGFRLAVYIDPGTGSMLFTIIIGLAATALYALKGLRIKIKYLLSGGKAKEAASDKIPYVVYSDNKRYWSVFEPVLDEFEKREIPVVYYTQSQDDPVFKKQYKYVSAEFIGEGSKGFARLNILRAGVVLSTTPGLDVYQWKRSKNVDKYVFITHSIDDGTVYRMFGLDYYDAILQTGQFALEKLRKLEKLRNLPAKDFRVVGSTYMDSMQKKYNERAKASETRRDKKDKTVLLAPSWGESAILSKYGEDIISALVNTGYRIIIRPHPQSFISEKEKMEALQKKFPESERLSWNSDTDNFNCLASSDIMISDFSAVVFDYSFIFDKPVIYAADAFDRSVYDAAWLDEEIWTFEALSKIGKKLKKEDFGRLKDMIDEMTEDKSYEELRKSVRDEGWCNKGLAAGLTVDYLTAGTTSEKSEAKAEAK